MNLNRRFKVKDEKPLAKSEINLPVWLSEEQKQEIAAAIKEGTPILITGKQGPTGKTYLANLLKEQGVLAFEEWECVKVTLNDLLEYESD
ncbi:hypothetical protein [Shouchella clausii]|uniref:hypothetical protein n=1 Tax=Shouchella clausii TaxID=79880 RepID=UPI000B95F0F4|nr:hypothetical protein [Shouchella clausii]AST97312.1 hypothetical protein BC8716_15660 [Shouchella clausii]MBU8597274.1 hypothetical protein [Shouchella clausii]MCR1287872.1 hypothetical protein [Shouchella clausii]MCY1106468.1 hypothetical protein [Shouchella clausii]MEB5473218.1 hypothetical protein [Shouchella clausii]